MKTKYLNDQWTLEDGLGIAGTGDLLARMVLEVQPPFSVRVTGKWGSGKTSVLRRAFATLGGQPIQQAVPLGEPHAEKADWAKWKYENEENHRQLDLQWASDLYDIAEKSLCIWYSPWQHQGTENPLIPLLLEIQAQFGTWLKIKEKLKDINRRGGLAALNLIERVVDASISLTAQKNIKIAQGTTESVRKTWKEAAPNLTTLSDGQRFHLMFEDAVQNILLSISEINSDDKSKPAKKTDDKLNNERLIIFIDDLDRCEESVVINLLECIKLYLGSPNCVFVLGIDDNAVLGAMKRTWSGRSDGDNREYLEKMFQATLAVPLPKPDSIQKSIRDQLEAHKFPKDKDEQGYDCAEVIEKLLEPNPRKIKNFCNSLCAAWNQFRGKDSSIENYAHKFILFHYLRLFHRPVWSILERQPVALKLLLNVFNYNSQDVLEEQRMLKFFFEQAFFHVLRDDTTNKEDKDIYKYHRSMDLAQAVEAFHERQDSKRSDEFFISQFKTLIDPNEKLRDEFLYLPGKKTEIESEEDSSDEGISGQPESPGDESPG